MLSTFRTKERMASRDPDEQCEPLLRTNVKYYENCPGCKVEKLKEKRKEYPLKELILLGFLVLCNALPVSSLYSFSYYMETLHNHCFECEEKGLNDHLEFYLEDNPIQEQNRGNIKGQNVHRKSLIKNWPVMSSIIISCVYSFHTTAYAEIFPLWAESPKAFRGLGFTTNDVGVVLSITGVGVLIFQLLVFPPLVNCAGVILITRIAAVLSIPVLTSYPFIAMLSGAWLWVAVTCASLLRNVFSGAVSTGTSLLLNNSVSQDQRGAANGIAVTGISLFQAFGPTAGGSIFAWAQEHQNTSFLPGNEMVFFMLNTIVVIIIVMTFEPFLPRSTDKPNHSKGQLKSKEDEEEPTTKQDEQLSS